MFFKKMLPASIGNSKLAYYNLRQITLELCQIIELQADELR